MNHTRKIMMTWILSTLKPSSPQKAMLKEWEDSHRLKEMVTKGLSYAVAWVRNVSQRPRC
jgi:hypothetical protein